MIFQHTRYFAFIIAAMVCLPTQLAAQWTWSNPLPQGSDLWTVSFAPSSQTGWAVGGAGVIVRTLDGGMSWSTQECGRDDFLRGVEAVDASNVWAVGDNGVVLRSSNAGAGWQLQPSGTTAGINMIRAISTTTAAFVGDAGMLHTTTNGGQSWVPRSTGTSNNLNDVFFTSTMDGIAVGAGKTIIRTSNGGAAWTPVFLAGMTFDLIGVFFIDAQRGWTCGSGGRIFRSTDGGASWQNTSSPTSADLNRIVFRDAQNGWAAGENGALLRSTNGGVSWTAVASGTVNGLEGIDLAGTAVVAVGVFGDIVRSANGTSFGMITSGFRGTINAVSAAPPSTAWAVGSGGNIIQTSSAGQSWQQLTSGTTQALYAVDNIAGATVVACGNGGVIVRSSNGGTTWSSVTSGTTVALNGIDLLDNGVGYIVGGSGRILKTTNGGAGWYAVASGTIQPLYAVHFTDAQRGTVVGADGLILGTTNGGYTWTPQQGWTLDALFGVIRDGDEGMVCGDDGTVIYTDDGGTSWTTLIVPTSAALFRLTHPAPGEYAAVGEDGVVMRTSNGGQSWVREISHAMYTIYGADAHGGNVYAVGDFGLVLHNGSYPYPIELLSFTVAAEGDCALLRWETAREEAHHGSFLQRRIDPASSGTATTTEDSAGSGSWSDVAYFPSLGENGGRYEWRDCVAEHETRLYRLKSVGLGGELNFSDAITFVSVAAEQSKGNGMSIESWPQPVRGDMSVRIHDAGQKASFAVQDILGRTLYRIEIPETPEYRLILPKRLFPSSGTYLLVALDAHTAISTTITVLK